MDVKTIEECFRFRLLRKIRPDREKSKKSFDLAEKELNEARKVLGLDEKLVLKHVILSSYLAMFHSARAVLYRDGIQEKSHYAIFVYLNEKYSGEMSLAVLNLLNIHRIERHEAMYGFDYEPDREDAERALADALVFVREMGRALEIDRKFILF